MVAVSQRTLSTTNDAGTVDVVEGLTWWWTAGLRPGTVTGAVLLIVGVGFVASRGERWWREGRAVAHGTVVVPGTNGAAFSSAGRLAPCINAEYSRVRRRISAFSSEGDIRMKCGKSEN